MSWLDLVKLVESELLCFCRAREKQLMESYVLKYGNKVEGTCVSSRNIEQVELHDMNLGRQ